MSDELGKAQNPAGHEKAKSSSQDNQAENAVAQSKVEAESRSPAQLPHSINNPQKANNATTTAKPHPPNWCEKGTFWIEIIGIIGLAVYCIFTIKEWITFDKERQIMDVELHDAQNQRFLDERPWILLEGDAFTEILSEKHDSEEIEISFRNVGKTPAINVQCVNACVKNLSAVPEKDSIPTPPVNSSVLGADVVAHTISGAIPISVVQDASKGVPFYFYGTIWYDDIFHRHHWSQFCYEVKGDAVTPSWIRFTGMPIHNSCDEADTNQTQ